MSIKINLNVNPLSTNATKWSNTLKKNSSASAGELSVFDHFVRLAFERLIRLMTGSLLFVAFFKTI